LPHPKANRHRSVNIRVTSRVDLGKCGGLGPLRSRDLSEHSTVAKRSSAENVVKAPPAAFELAKNASRHLDKLLVLAGWLIPMDQLQPLASALGALRIGICALLT
jgi:hypothetical protein